MPATLGRPGAEPGVEPDAEADARAGAHTEPIHARTSSIIREPGPPPPAVRWFAPHYL